LKTNRINCTIFQRQKSSWIPTSPPKWPLTSLFDDLTDSRHPTAELKVASKLCAKNPRCTLYAIISVLNANFYENIIAHYKTHTFSKKTCSDDKKHLHESKVSQVSQILPNWQFVYMFKTV